MPKTHDVGRFFFHVIKVKKGTPLAHRAETNEVTGQYRTSNSLLVRTGFKRAIVLGWWKASGRTQDEQLGRAMRADRLNKHATPGTKAPAWCGVHGEECSWMLHDTDSFATYFQQRKKVEDV